MDNDQHPNIEILRQMRDALHGARGQRLRTERRALEWALNSLAVMALLNELRAGDGDTVTLCCDNPDFEGPDNVVECCADWTDWKDRRFTGDSLLDALTAAAGAKAKASTEGTPQ